MIIGLGLGLEHAVLEPIPAVCAVSIEGLRYVAVRLGTPVYLQLANERSVQAWRASLPVCRGCFCWWCEPSDSGQYYDVRHTSEHSLRLASHHFT